MDERTKELAEKMRAGCQDAFDEIYRREAERLYRVAFMISGNSADSEDILQETFVQCYLHRSEIRNLEGFKKWLMTILVRTAWKTVKKRKKVVSIDEWAEQDRQRGSEEQIYREEAKEGVYRSSREENPLELYIKQEERNQIYDAVCGLDMKIRTVMILYYYQDFSVRDIAKITGTLEGTVKSRLHTGRKMLKKKLEKTGIANMDTGRVHG